METCLILFARRYDFRDDDGKHVAGMTLTYLTDDVLQEQNNRGCSPLNVSAPLELWDELDQLPGYYEIDFRQRPGAKGKPTLTVCAATFLEPFSIAKQG